MKSSYLSVAAALACALGLAACGGEGNGELLLGGTAVGVTKEGLVLQNNGGDDLPVPTSGNFTFNKLISMDSDYKVTPKSIPSNAEKCEVFNGEGRSAFNVLNVQVVCTLKKHALSGSITSLGNNTGLVLLNGSDRKEIPPNATSFAMDTVGEDVPFGISILTQPVNRMCSITRGGVGTMGTADVTNVQIDCVTAP